jgi:phage portal protein BeeE
MVTPMIGEDGSVYYQLSTGPIGERRRAGRESVRIKLFMIEARLCIIRWSCVSPIFACGMSATQGLRIQQNSAAFFSNMSRPSGTLTAPGSISNDVAQRLRRNSKSNFSGGNVGRLLVAGDGLSYQGFKRARERRATG